MKGFAAKSFSTHKLDSFLSGTSSIYVEQMYDAWRKDKSSVHVSWQSYFANVEAGVATEQAFAAPNSISGSVGRGSSSPLPAAGASNAGALLAGGAVSSDSLGISYLIRAYQVRGHEIANLDPLGLYQYRKGEPPPPELSYERHGFTDADLDRPLNLLGTSTGGHTGFLQVLGGGGKGVTLRQVWNQLRKTYTGSMGVEYMHMGSQEKCNWIRDRVESPEFMKFSKEKKMHIHERLAFADLFEKFLANKFNTAKRFGIEGGDNLIPGLKAMIDRGSELGIESFSFGMPHRGRLNVLANVMRKPMPQIFKEFQGTHYDLEDYLQIGSDRWSSSGDVKYHLGSSVTRTYPDGRTVNISLSPNPSHLEAVDPVVIGETRAKQFGKGNKASDFQKHMPVVMHGDAAFAGQGIVYETIQMSRVPDFAVGGTLHIVVNNQVGFTTNPTNGRSTLYCSDLGKAFNIPIFHCNGDDPISVVAAFELAVEWRQKFNEDCIIDLICYRRFGHNELDQPMYTQPLMYNIIKDHPDTLTTYEKQLLESGVTDTATIENVRNTVTKTFDDDFIKSKDWFDSEKDWLSGQWAGLQDPNTQASIHNTGVDVNRLREIGLKASSFPKEFTPHAQLKKIFKARADSIQKGEGIDWGTAEALAFGTLLTEGIHVRLSGQDVERGTFSHRHAALVDQNTGEKYYPLNHLEKTSSPSVHVNLKPTTNLKDIQSQLTVCNSILSEFAVLGFEMGYSMENPNTLVLWEAQFGDFVNGAQTMIDQFISAGEDKWLRQTGLTMLLPHGYMGQGAEHSSCRIERFLQQVDEDPDYVPNMEEATRLQIQRCNMQVLNCTTPANYFHALRRQVRRQFRKPLIIATPKNLLREKRCTSSLEEMGGESRFQRVIPEVNDAISSNPEAVKRVSCSFNNISC